MARVALTNREVREWYLNEVAGIPELNRQWEAEGASLPDRARRAWEIRHRARVAARAMMADPAEAAALGKRDVTKYGNPDGPTFDQLLTEATGRGLSDEQAYLAILESSIRTDADTNRKYTQ